MGARTAVKATTATPSASGSVTALYAIKYASRSANLPSAQHVARSLAAPSAKSSAANPSVKCVVLSNTAKRADAPSARLYVKTRSAVLSALTQRPSASPSARNQCVTGNAIAPTTTPNPSALSCAKSPRTAKSLLPQHPVPLASSLLVAFLWCQVPQAGLYGR